MLHGRPAVGVVHRVVRAPGPVRVEVDALATWRDVHGERFMPEEDPRAELAPRDVVAQAIFRTMERTQHPNVYLDLSHLDPVKVRERFPGINRVCRSFGLDITKDRVPVRPGAHYMVGGVTVDVNGRTKLPGLWAAGEVTSSGLHGANRLASNSLLEGLVYGAHAGAGARATLPGEVCMIALGAVFDEPADAAVRAALADIQEALLPHRAGDYPNFVEQPADASGFFAPAVWQRLRAVKSQYDPADLFSGGHHIPPTEA